MVELLLIDHRSWCHNFRYWCSSSEYNRYVIPFIISASFPHTW